MTEGYFVDHHAFQAAYVPFVSELAKGGSLSRLRGGPLSS